jgi:small subunit ribosomal protein S11
MATKRKTPTKKKTSKAAVKLVTEGRLYIKATFNNTIVTITDDKGNVISWNTTGKTGFKGARKSTPYAATTTIEAAVNEAKTKGLNSVAVFIKGPGPGRDAVLRVLRNSQLEIISIADVTPIPHNGCRPKKPRRV